MGASPASAAGRVASKQSLAQALNILGFREHDAQRTLSVCLETLERYCQSRDYSLSAHHLPHFKLSLSSLESKVLLEYSSQSGLTSRPTRRGAGRAASKPCY
jgi:hypothetical protein